MTRVRAYLGTLLPPPNDPLQYLPAVLHPGSISSTTPSPSCGITILSPSHPLSLEIFAAGNHYPFTHQGLDTLALDPGIVRSWQYIGGAVSHSPLIVLRAYLYTKLRCHAALEGYRFRSYGTREEYRVTGAVFKAMDAIWRARGTADMPLILPERVQEGMALGVHLNRTGYAWMADKIDWAAMIFLPTHRPHLVFNTPSLQSAYHARYWQIVRAREDFILFYDIFSRL
ncbi:uncharacterized protein N7496_010712 [Penicillium cataractarum]|uniref:Uncharacterized protein n=1 Tax=Penicillium cataractarum TaxID=2100454 RepID=A0A9W9RU28_9EURO|nr:uncharacterized protein N7496_010712 [Penicillium cataractarum]KAJ5364999.1 hypothetical protein N7496_010712 [Penicillium cataractarum]